MGPVLWWWRWWLGEDPTQDRRVSEARALLDEQQARSVELEQQLRARDEELQRAETRLTSARRDQQTAETDLEAARTELEDAQHRLATATDELEDVRTELQAVREELAAARAAEAAAATANGSAAAGAGEDEPDVSAAGDVLGSSITANDLTVIDGIGPKIAGVLSDAGIATWRALGASDVAHLREVLEEASPRYRAHDPVGWPAQAQLLAQSRWQEFAELSSS